MLQGRPAPPRVTRETRLLLMTALVSLVVLWGLARMRFPDRPVSANPLPPVLTQLAVRSPLEETAALVADLMPRLAPWAAAVDLALPPPAGALMARESTRPAFRFREELAVVLLEDAVRAGGTASVVVHDQVSGLAIVQVPSAAWPDPPLWSPRRLDLPRFLVEADAPAGELSVRPVFVGGLRTEPSALWGSTIWLLPPAADLRAGSAALTPEGALLGLVVARDSGTAIVPWTAVQARAEQILRAPPPPPVQLGIGVQAVTTSIAAATGTAGGVIVTRVATGGPAASILEPGDVIETADGQPIASIDDWRVQSAGLAGGESIVLGVRRSGEVRDVRLVAAAPDEEDEQTQPLGLTLRTINGTGTEVQRVGPGSAAALAGLRAGDVIVRVGDVRRPTAAQVTRTYTSAPAAHPVLLVVARGDEAFALTITRHP